MKSIKARIETAERKQEREPPFDLAGRYYDTLTQAEKRRYWKYYYGDSFTVEQAERLEVKHISGTLHFECTLSRGTIPSRNLTNGKRHLIEHLINY